MQLVFCGGIWVSSSLHERWHLLFHLLAWLIDLPWHCKWCRENTHTHIDRSAGKCVCVSVCMCVPKQCILLVGPLWGLDLLCFSHVVTFPICLSIQPESRLVPWEPPFTPRSLPYRNKGQSLALKVISHVDKNSNFLRRGCSVAANHVEYWQYIPEALALFTDRTVH